MNHDVSAGCDAEAGCVLFVVFIGIGDTNWFVEAALGVAAIEEVLALRRLVVALLLLGADWGASRATLYVRWG